MKTLLVALLFTVLAGCSKTPRRTVADVAQQVFGGPEHMAAMSSSAGVTAYRLHSKPHKDGPSEAWALAGYDQGENVQLSNSQVVLIKQLLQQPTSYDFDVISLCIPEYGVLLVFHTQPQDIRLALCFHCGQMAVFEGDRTLNKLDNFFPMRPKLLSLAKVLFPKDPEIQGLQ